MRSSSLTFLRSIVTAFVLIASCICAKAQQKTEILWDTYGVPHIYATNVNNMYYGFGWSQMHAHGNLLLRLYAQARGKGAELLGAEHITGDKHVMLFDLTALSKQHYGKQNKEGKQLLDAFVKGLNDYASKHPDALDPALLAVLPITPEDVIAHGLRVISLRFLGGADIAAVANETVPGSNAYAIAPSRSASGNAMLVTNPHLPWSDLFIFFEAHLVSPGFNAYGVSLIGQPALNIAFNEHLGWTHTVNTIDAADRYALTLKDDGYVLDGATQQFGRKDVTIKVKQKDGSHTTETFTALTSKHGPVLGQKNGKAFAVRIAGLENAFFSEQYHKMAASKTLAEFEKALRMMQNPMFNVIYADKAGNILYLFNGNVPVRPEGDFAFWSRTVDGTQSKYIWNSYHRYDELPRLLNPSTGFIQNANDPPWTSTYPVQLKPGSYPSYMSPTFTALRPQRAINMIKDDKSITFDELVNYKLNTGMEAADRFLDDLFAATASSTDSAVQDAITVLKKWDKQTNNDSRGAVLFARWLDKLTPSMFKTPWNIEQPVTTPDGLADPEQAVGLLKKAAEETKKMYGSLDVAWGDVNRFKVGNTDVAGNGGSGNYGIFRVMQFRPGTGKNYAASGDTYVAVTEFGKKVKAKVLLSYGNASQPGNKHVGDQLQLLSEKRLRDALFYREDVMKSIERKEVLK